MAKRDPNYPRRRALILDCNTTALLDTNPPLYLAVGDCQRLGCYWEYAHSTGTSLKSAISDKQLHGDWDLIYVPILDSATAYTNLNTILAKIDASIPVAVVQARGPAATATEQGVSGAATDATAVAAIATTFDWAHPAWRMTFHGEHLLTFTAAALANGAKKLATDGTNTPMWRNDVQGHPTLWIAGYASSLSNSSIHKPWLAFQWMMDQKSRSAKLDKSCCVMRIDSVDEALGAPAWDAGYTQALYEKALLRGHPEILLAIAGLGDPGANRPDVMAWFAARDRSKGGLFNASNHHVDVTQGAFNCSSDNVQFDQFVAAGREYERVCDILTGFGFRIGEYDGYGKDSWHINISNRITNPSSMFLAGGENPSRTWDATDGKYYGGYGLAALCIREDLTYPSAGATPAVNMRYSRDWNGARTLAFSATLDSLAGSAADIAVTACQVWNKCLLYGGGFYLHGSRYDDWLGYDDEYYTLLSSCPDVWVGGPFSEVLKTLKRGAGTTTTIT